jgi:phosphatidylinositol glycan class Z
VITPLNNLRYNTSTINLAQHGLHPYYQHVAANLPQLLGPALPLIFFARKTWHLCSAIFGTLILSAFPHQEARFLLPAIPLILSSIQLPRRLRGLWVGFWIVFNVILAVVMGIYHQGGVVPAQIHLGQQDNITDVFWWKTYSPPVWLLNGKSADIVTHDLMGIPGKKVIDKLLQATPCNNTSLHPGRSASEGVLLVAPRSAAFLDKYLGLDNGLELVLEEVWSYKNHINLDDMDFGDDGVWPTISRVAGRRGLVIRRVRRDCGGGSSA